MVLSYMEEMITKFYRSKGYSVSHNVIYKVRDEKGKETEQLKNISTLAINDKEAVIINFRPYIGHTEEKLAIKSLLQDFDLAEQSIKDIPDIKGKKIIKLLVVEEPLKQTDDELNKKGVNVQPLEEIMIDFLIILLNKHRGKRLESRATDIIRNLIFAIVEEKI